MNIEKLIERMNNHLQSLAAYSDPELAHTLEDAATALSTLQAENDKLWAEQEQAKAEIIRLKYYEDKCHDCPIVCAKTEIIKAHEELEAVQAGLERVKQENSYLKERLHGVEKS